MKRMKSNNWCYLVGILPFIIIMLIIAVVYSKSLKIEILLTFAAIMICVFVVKKFLCIPYSMKKYGEMKEIDMKLPDDWDIKIYSCKEMDRYPFLKRYIEIVSPLLPGKNSDVRVVVSPAFLKKYKPRFVEICVTREILKYCRKVQIKLTLGLVIPILTWIIIIEAFFLSGWKDIFDRYSGITNFFGPILTAAVIIITLFIWNKSVSQMDYQMDAELKNYYGDEVADYIRRWDEIMVPDDKELIKKEKREIELHYIRKRIEKL